MGRKNGMLVLGMLLFALSSFVSGDRWYKSNTCPDAERIIRETVNDHFKWDNTIVAGVLRLHFHDCFVDGCDGSILLDWTPTDGKNVEKTAIPNANSARGFELIEDAKARLETACPGTVSCADILAIAARDSSVMLGGAHYTVPTGRYDGRVSSAEKANNNLPSPFSEAKELIENFRRQGLSEEDLVLLSGGHTIGTSKCFAVEGRLYNFNSTGRPDPTINSRYLTQLQKMCPQGGSPVATVELDRMSQFQFDNSYYKNLVYGNGILTSDQTLAKGSTSRLVHNLAHRPKFFAQKFTVSMIKMGRIGWKTRYNGEIRRMCGMVNSYGA